MSKSSNARRKGVGFTKKQRAAFEAQLPLPCSHCGGAVMPGTRWDLDHLIPVALGGTAEDSNGSPSHRDCNRRAGQAMTTAARRARKDREARVVKW